MMSLKRLAVVSACLGAGFGIVCALVVGGIYWYLTQFKPKEPWNTTAITSIYYRLTTEGDRNTLLFSYVLQNNTDFDYTLTEASDVILMSKLEEHETLGGVDEHDQVQFLTGGYPFFLPARQRTTFDVHVLLPYEEKMKPDATEEERKEYYEKLEDHIDKTYSNLVLLPISWRKPGKFSA